jgi:hypothetical protein
MNRSFAEYSSVDVIDGTGITRRQLHWWIEHGAIRPTHRARRGTHNPHLWSDTDRRRLAHIAGVLEDLAALGVHHTPHLLVGRMWAALELGHDSIEQRTVTIRLGLEDG